MNQYIAWSETSAKCPSWFLRAQADVLRFLVLSDQQTKAQRHLNPHILKAGTRECLAFFFDI